MEITLRGQYELITLEHEERLRQAEQARRVRQARAPHTPRAAASTERRFSLFRRFVGQPSEA